jgi:hypothetical protein
MTLAVIAVAPCHGGDYLQEKFAFAEIVEAAGVASEKCPGLHLIEENLEAATKDSGASDNDIYFTEYDFWAARGRANAIGGYTKDPAHWCDQMWQFLGPGHPPMVHRTLLRKD